MHLLEQGYAQNGVHHDVIASTPRPTQNPSQQNPSQTASPAVSMDHLDALEAQSIYIFREAFARLKKLALLWSLGKDSSVMIWLGANAVLGQAARSALQL